MHDDHSHGHSHSHSHSHGHSHDHDHGPAGHSHAHAHAHASSHAGAGHNRARAAAQWQVPHLPAGTEIPQAVERDLDLVEASFVEGFSRATDTTSFLRLAGIAFVGLTREGTRLHLLRVEIEDRTDVGSIVPLIGGQGVRYDPLPVKLSARRRALAFIYHDGSAMQRLDFASARALKDESEASQFSLTVPDGP